MSLAKVLFRRKPVSCLLLAYNIGHHFPSAEPTALPCLLRKWRLQTYTFPLLNHTTHKLVHDIQAPPSFLLLDIMQDTVLFSARITLLLTWLHSLPNPTLHAGQAHTVVSSYHTLSLPYTLCNSHLETLSYPLLLVPTRSNSSHSQLGEVPNASVVSQCQLCFLG